MTTKQKTKTARRSLRRMVRHYRKLKLKERIRPTDEFYFYCEPRFKWKRVTPDQAKILNHLGGVPEHYRGRFRRLMYPAKIGA
jgi:hypothetical protein